MHQCLLINMRTAHFTVKKQLDNRDLSVINGRDVNFFKRIQLTHEAEGA